MSKRGNRKKPDTIFKLTISAESLEDDDSSDFKLYMAWRSTRVNLERYRGRSLAIDKNECALSLSLANISTTNDQSSLPFDWSKVLG